MRVSGACLQVRKAGHDDIDVQLSAIDGRLYEVRQICARVLQRSVQPQSSVCCHLSHHSSLHDVPGVVQHMQRKPPQPHAHTNMYSVIAVLTEAAAVHRSRPLSAPYKLDTTRCVLVLGPWAILISVKGECYMLR